MVYLGTQGTWHLSIVARGFWLALIGPLLWSITPSEVILARVVMAALLLGLACLCNRGVTGLLTSGMTLKFQLIALLMGFACNLELLSWFTAVKNIDVSKEASITAPAPAVKMRHSLVVLQQENKAA
jgi:uncharacterized membrane protein